MIRKAFDWINRDEVLFGVFVLSYAALFAGFFLIDAARYLRADSFQASVDNRTYFLAVLLLIILLVVYRTVVNKKKPLVWSVIFVILLYVSLSFIQPLLSSDVFSYVYQGRVRVIGGLNPYASSYDAIFSDPFRTSLANTWSGRTAPYGPFFTLIEIAMAWLFRFDPLSAVAAWKLFFSACALSAAAVIWLGSKSKEAVFLFAFNPLVIVEVAINGHNDALFVLFLSLAIFFAVCKKNNLVSSIFLTLSILTKYLSFVLVPIWLLYAWRKVGSFRDKMKLFLAIAAGIIITTITVWPFRSDVGALGQSVLDQAGQSGAFVSPLIAIIRFLMPGLPGWPAGIGRLVFLIIYIWILVRAWHDPEQEDLVFNSFVALSAFILCSLSWMMPWYFVSLIALAAMFYTQARYRLIALWSIYSLTFYGIINYVLLR